MDEDQVETEELHTSNPTESLRRAEVRRRCIEQLFEAMDRLAALPMPPLSEAEVEAEIQAVRVARRQVWG